MGIFSRDENDDDPDFGLMGSDCGNDLSEMNFGISLIQLYGPLSFSVSPSSKNPTLIGRYAFRGRTLV